MEVTAVPANYVTAVYIPDTIRDPKHQPGKLVYSAQFSKEHVLCLYKVMYFPFWCALEDLVAQTSIDVYTNGVNVVKPDSCGFDCFLPRNPVGTFRYFDHGAFEEPATTGRLIPCPCTLASIMGYLGFFGEQTNFTSKIINSIKPSGLGHTFSGCCPIILCEAIHGLSTGEGARLAGIINEQVRLFKQNPNSYGLDAVAQSGGVKMV